MGESMNAIAYAEKGWVVMPLRKQSKEPCKFLRHGYLDASADLNTIKKWFQDPELNIGLAIKQSALVVLDFDKRNATNKQEWQNYFQWCIKLNTHTVKTDDGYHFYFKANPELQFKGKLATGIDIKHKGYVVLPPSIHPNGTQYSVMNDVEPIDLPDGLMKAMTW